MLWPFRHLLFTKWLPARQTTENSNKWHCPGTHWCEGRPVACHPRARLTHGVTCQSFGGARAQPWKRTNKNSEPVLAMAGAGPGNLTPCCKDKWPAGSRVDRRGSQHTWQLGAGHSADVIWWNLPHVTVGTIVPTPTGEQCWPGRFPHSARVTQLASPDHGPVPWAPAEQDGPCCVDTAASRRPVAWTPAPARSHLRPQGLAAIFTPCSDTPAAKRISEMHSGRLHGLAETPGFHGSGPAGPSTKAGVFPGSAPRTPAIQTDSLSRSPWVWLSRTENKRAFSICYLLEGTKGLTLRHKRSCHEIPCRSPLQPCFPQDLWKPALCATSKALCVRKAYSLGLSAHTMSRRQQPILEHDGKAVTTPTWFCVFLEKIESHGIGSRGAGPLAAASPGSDSLSPPQGALLCAPSPAHRWFPVCSVLRTIPGGVGTIPTD